MNKISLVVAAMLTLAAVPTADVAFAQGRPGGDVSNCTQANRTGKYRHMSYQACVRAIKKGKSVSTGGRTHGH